MRAARARNQRPGPLCALWQRRGNGKAMRSNSPARSNATAGSETYLDWNATAPLRPEAAAAMSAVLARCGNPSSVHRWGRAARQTVERARLAVGALLDAPPEGVVFVSGGTEANHLALLGSGRERILISAVEHDSVRRAAPEAEQISVDREGIIALDALDEW